MRSVYKLSASLLLVISLYSTSIYADWGSFLEDLATAGKELLSSNSDSSTDLDYDTIVSGLKEALDIGTRHAVDNVSQVDGYLANELIRIAMPPQLQQVTDLMRKFGLSGQADAFEQSMNHAAEAAAPQATALIVDAIKNMSIEDANTILQGDDDAATQYFRDKTTTQLTELFRPTIENSLNQVGTTKYYNDLAGQIAAIPLIGENVNLDLPDYVTEQALNGLFTVIAQEEKKIRENPAARTTELLKQVFRN
ncbi:MAG: DUF4197 domain-containing protein [Piscirickettsiaceae bacterium]|nr:DUF4197 domain-containing protein [Piscirickettsiaceae bacterium]